MMHLLIQANLEEHRALDQVIGMLSELRDVWRQIIHTARCRAAQGTGTPLSCECLELFGHQEGEYAQHPYHRIH